MLRALRQRLKRWSSRAPTRPDPATEVPLLTSDSDGPPEQHEGHTLPYDENLLERARTQWQFGDWNSLAKLDRDTLHHHPDRAKLALLAAAGHQQLNNLAAARQFARLALDWGVSKTLISRLLIAGVHNTLGRAAAAAQQSARAMKHFESAIATGTPGSDLRLLAQARVGSQLAQLGLARPATLQTRFAGSDPLLAHSDPPQTARLSEATKAISEQLEACNAELVAQIKQQQDQFASLRTEITRSFKKEMLNATKQLEAFLEVHSYLNTGELLPAMHGWPISPDFALYLIELLETNDYDLIIEFGSGTSTVLMAKTLARLAARRTGKPPVRQVAFEHLEKYYAQTLASLRQARLDEAVQLVHAPLQPYSAPNGITYSYYACHDTLAKLATALWSAGLRVLVVVDGPPGATGPHARYPAVPAAIVHFAGAHIDVLLDDYARSDEHEIAQMWLTDLRTNGFESTLIEKQMEKDACLLRIAPLAPTPETSELHTQRPWNA